MVIFSPVTHKYIWLFFYLTYNLDKQILSNEMTRKTARRNSFQKKEYFNKNLNIFSLHDQSYKKLTWELTHFLRVQHFFWRKKKERQKRVYVLNFIDRRAEKAWWGERVFFSRFCSGPGLVFQECYHRWLNVIHQFL